MNLNKPLSILESAFPFVFFTESFSNPNEFHTAKIEFCKNNIGSHSNSIDKNEPLDSFFRNIFYNPQQLKEFFEILKNKGQIQGFSIDLNEKFFFSKSCRISTGITRLRAGEYFLQGFLAGGDTGRETVNSSSDEKKMLEGILSGIGDGVCVYDKDHRVIFESPLHSRWFGNSKEFMCLNGSGSGAKTINFKGSNRTVQTKADGKDSLSLEISAYPIKNKEGSIFAGINIVRNVTGILNPEPQSRRPEISSEISKKENPPPQLIRGNSPAIKKVRFAMEKIGKLNTAVLILGEAGTGKELVARTIHDLSPRKNHPFAIINCGALSEVLLESELFGHARGTFSADDAEGAGKLETCEGGTVFLNEIGELPIGIQKKLLRFLLDGKISKRGSDEVKDVNVRMICDSQMDLEKRVGQGKFKKELLDQIRPFTINIPSLRERDDDTLLIADHFLNKFAREHNKNIKKISKDAALQLKEHSWPGNIRELKNIIERAVIICNSDTIGEADLPLIIKKAGDKKTFAKENLYSLSLKDRPLNPVKKRIVECLEKNRWNKTLTAKDLNISRATLWRRIKEYSIPTS